MKQTEKMIQNKKHDAFQSRLNNWQSVIGLANWNISSPTTEQYRTYENRGRTLQAEALRGAFSSLVRWSGAGIVKMVSSTITAIKKYQQHQQDISELVKLNDRQLKDIGLNRADVYAFAHHKVTAEQFNEQRLGPDSHEMHHKKNHKLALTECSTSNISDPAASKCANDADADKMAS